MGNSRSLDYGSFGFRVTVWVLGFGFGAWDWLESPDGEENA